MTSQTTAPNISDPIDPFSFDVSVAKGYQAAENMLADRVILVTGAGDGIGKVAAKNYAACGAIVILAGRTVAKLEATYDEIKDAGHPEPVIYPIDLAGANEDDYEQLTELIENELGRLDGVLLNASHLGARRALPNYQLSDWDSCMNTNVRSQFLMIRALLPLLENSDQGRIIFTTSSVGRLGKAHWGAYAVSKFATEGLMRVLSNDLDGISNVRVNAINPGATRTRMRATAYPAENPADVVPPEEIMWLYLYLMGPDSSEISGQTIDAQ